MSAQSGGRYWACLGCFGAFSSSAWALHRQKRPARAHHCQKKRSKNRENGGRTKFDREFHFTHTPSRRAGAHLPRHLAAMQNGVRRPARDDVAVPLAPEPSLRRRRGSCHRGGHRSGIQPPPTRPSRGLGGHRGAATRAPDDAELLPSRSVDCMYPFTLEGGGVDGGVSGGGPNWIAWLCQCQ